MIFDKMQIDDGFAQQRTKKLAEKILPQTNFVPVKRRDLEQKRQRQK